MKASASSAQSASTEGLQRPARGSAHLWLPRGLGDTAILLALALDRRRGHPDNCTATARMIGVHRDTVRRHRDELVVRGLAILLDGFLVATDAGRALLRHGCDPLPRALLRGRSERPSLAVMRACAVVYADAVGWRADRRGCRSDAERAAVAGVSRRLVVAARALLAERDLIDVEALRRGRADLRRARLTADRCATHGSPMRDERANRIAEHARRGRSRLAGGAEPGNSGGAETVIPPLQVPTGPSPMQAPVAPTEQGVEPAQTLEGCPESQQGAPGSVDVRTASAEQRRRSNPAAVGDILRDLVPELPTAQAESAMRTTKASSQAIDRLRRLAADSQAMGRLLRMPAPRAVGQLLAAVGVLDQAPRRRDGLAVQVAQVLAPAQVLTLALDVALSKPRSIAGTLQSRLKRAANGESSLVTHCRAGWALGQFLAAILDERGHEPADSRRRTSVTGSPLRKRSRHHVLAIRVAADAARRQDWRRVDAILSREGVCIDELASATAMPAHELQQRLDELAAGRRARFAEGRATA